MPHPPRDIDSGGDIDPGPHNVPVKAPAVFVPTTNLNFLSLSSFDDRLADGDRINIVIEGSNLPHDQVQIRLRTQPGMWFKGVESHAHGAVVKLEAENGQITGAHTLHSGELSTVAIILVKAKFAGVHTPMYELPGGALAPLLGKRIIFDWMTD